MHSRILLLFVVGTWAIPPNPFTPPTTLLKGQDYHLYLDNFCVNFTTQTVTFTADISNLYNASGLPWNQFIVAGTGNNLISELSGNFPCTTIASLPSLPSHVPVPYQAFVEGINQYNDFRFPAQTGTQDTYQALNTAGIAQAVQIIQDSTTHNQNMMRFFIKTSFASIGRACSALGTAYSEVDNDVLPNKPVLQYTADVPFTAIARSSQGTVVSSTRFLAATQTTNNDFVVSVTGGINYQLEAFLEDTFVDSSQCPTGQVQMVLQFGMEYTSLNSSYLVQGPRTVPGLTIYPNCYNISTRSVVRPPCTNGVCVSRVLLQTSCRPALSNGMTFATCAVGQSPFELTDVFFDAHCSFCKIGNTSCSITGNGASILSFTDKVRASVSFKAASQFLQVVQLYASRTAALTAPLLANFTMQSGQTVWVAALFPYPEIQRHFALLISNSSSQFSFTGYSMTGQKTGSLGYTGLVAAGVITVGVRSLRNSQGGLVACDAVLGCDSFAINATALGQLWPQTSQVDMQFATLLPPYTDPATVQPLGFFTVNLAQNITLSLAPNSSSNQSLTTFIIVVCVVMGTIAAIAIVILIVLNACFKPEYTPL